jgi:site-specific DNA-methyltransferase (adenine-specific)
MAVLAVRAMNSALMFSRASDEWATPYDLFQRLHAEFWFTLDAAATAENAKTPAYLSAELDALTLAWSGTVWLNPPYSQCARFIAKAAAESRRGCTVVCLVPARTDTRWFHAHIWDADQHQPRPGVEVRFLKGRLKFGDSPNSAPFPSLIVIFRPAPAQADLLAPVIE